MNTPAHVILSAVILGRGRTRENWLAITTGALLPDLPMVGFYVFQRFGLDRSDGIIWSQLYFDPDWQQFFDLFNSLPLIAVGAALALSRQSRAALALFLSMALHVAADLPVHREDAHGHFYPLSNWHFVSPISYWDPAHHGLIVGALEAVGVLAGSVLLIRRGSAWRYVGITTIGLYAIFAVFAIRYWTGG